MRGHEYRLGYRADLEGLRAVAILLVVAVHAGVPWLRGGFVGVDVFFVLSGFLITGLLVQEVSNTGRLRFAEFYVRRLRRLLPALLIMLLVVGTLAALLLAPDIAERIVVVWLGGHALEWPDTREFNLKQDVGGAQVLFDSGVPVVLVPCMGVTSHLHSTVPEIERYVEPCGEIGRFLAARFKEYSSEHMGWSKEIWDMAPVGWLLDPAWAPGGEFLVYSSADPGTRFPVKAIRPDGQPYPMPELTLSRGGAVGVTQVGARRLRFLPGQAGLVVLRGDIQHKDLWARDLGSGAWRELTRLSRDIVIGDFDVSPDGTALVLERVEEDSDIVVIDRAD